MKLTAHADSLNMPTIWRNNKLRVAIFLAGLLLLFTNEFTRLDKTIYDWLLTTKPPAVQQDTVIVAIDDKSIKKIGRWPWSRDVHATLLNSLSSSKAKAIGFDILFTEPDDKNPDRDKNFAKAIESNSTVILAVAPFAPEKTISDQLLPISILADKSAGLGHVDLEIDNDGFVRTVYLFAGLRESKWPSFALALAQLAKPNEKFETTALTLGRYWTRRQPILIPYSGVPNAITTYSYIDVLNKSIPLDAFKNKVIIVGITATGLSEKFATPFSSNHQNMTGVELNSHIVNGLMNNQTILKTEPWLAYSIKFIIILLSLIATYFLSSMWLIPGTIAQIFITLSVSASLLYGLNIWFEPALTIVAQLLIYCLASFIHTKNSDQTIEGLEKHVGYDPVTLLPTQQELKKTIVNALRESNGNLTFAIAIINIGEFKKVNELLGFRAGDHLLNIASTRINTCIDQKHICSRFNGPEFAIFFKGIPDQQALDIYCDTLFGLLGKSYQVQDKTFTLPISIGVSFYPKHTHKIEAIFDNAAIAMQEIKKHKKNGIGYYDHKTSLDIIEHSKLCNDLQKALENNEIEIHYQPQVNTITNQVTGIEALARWNHPERGLIPPEDFIPMAEKSGLMAPIGQWVLENACVYLTSLHNKGHKHLRLSVNLSASQFSASDLTVQVSQALNNAQLSAKYLELELTESCLMQDITKAVSILTKFKHMGISLSIDDFGTGYSSLSYLKQFPVDKIKIDRSFINELETNIDAKEITLAIISMAHSLKMSVVAEGVETIEQKQFLRVNDCEELQGFYFSKPMSDDNLTHYLRETNTQNIA